MKFDDLPEVHQNLLGFLFDPHSDASLPALMPPRISERILEMIYQDPELFPLLGNEDELLALLSRKYAYKAPPSDCRVRMTFWMEYERALLEGDKMVLRNTHSLVCDERSFYRLFLSSPGRTAFLVCRPAAYQEQVREILSHGLKGYRRVLDMPIEMANGKIDYKLLAVQTKITAMMDMRLHGAPTQKVQQLNVNVDARSAGANAGDTQKLVAKGDMHAIKQRLAELEAEIGGEKKAGPVVIDIEMLEAK